MDRDDSHLSFRDRLEKAIGDQSPFPWAERLGIGKSTFSGPWNHGAIPQTKTLIKIAQNTDISLNWLLTGRGPETVHDGKTYSSQQNADYITTTSPSDTTQPETFNSSNKPSMKDMAEYYNRHEYVIVPQHKIKGADQLPLQSDQVVDHLAFKAHWIKQIMGLDSSQLALISNRGDSMEPTLKEGDLLLLDQRGFPQQGRVRSDAIYVLLHGDDLVAKRLQCGFDGSITIQSDNPAYSTQVLPAEKSNLLNIVGRVVWVGRRN